jgi:hypothetical protein
MPTCAGCKKSIKDSYLTALHQDWHAACFVCAGCRQVIQGSFLEKDGQPYHEACFHQRFSPRCAACQQPITGRYLTALDQPWHPQHFTCAGCKTVLDGTRFFERDGKPYCPACFHDRFTPKCQICQAPLIDEYLSDYWGNRYCQRHPAEYPNCFSCGRLVCQGITSGGVSYPDGRAVCTLCRATAIDRLDQGKAALSEVRQSLAKLGVDLGRQAIPFRLVAQTELVSLSTADYATDPAGLTRNQVWKQNGQEVRREVQEILILHGLAGEHFCTVAAHELAHAWLFLNHFPRLKPLDEEGFCELVEYLWLKGRSDERAAYRTHLIETNDDPVYGAGFQAAYRVYQRQGLSGVLDRLRRLRHL